jgi:hypothetical protein
VTAHPANVPLPSGIPLTGGRDYRAGMSTLGSRLVRGVVAGAVGTTALNAATYLDMAVRGRPASTTPEQAVRSLAGRVGVRLGGTPERREARETGAGALMGTVVGVSAGMVIGLARRPDLPRGRAVDVGVAWAVAMLAGNGPLASLGISDPRSWSVDDWLTDVLPHVAYAVSTALTLDLLET